jgi:inner membrane protein
MARARNCAGSAGRQGDACAPLLVTPTAFNTVLWRVVAIRDDGSYEEGFYSLFDQGRRLRLQRIEGSPPLRDALRGIDTV